MRTNLDLLKGWTDVANESQEDLPPGPKKTIYLIMYMIGHYALKSIKDLEHKIYIDSLNKGWKDERGRTEKTR